MARSTSRSFQTVQTVRYILDLLDLEALSVCIGSEITWRAENRTEEDELCSLADKREMHEPVTVAGAVAARVLHCEP